MSLRDLRRRLGALTASRDEERRQIDYRRRMEERRALGIDLVALLERLANGERLRWVPSASIRDSAAMRILRKACGEPPS